MSAGGAPNGGRRLGRVSWLALALAVAAAAALAVTVGPLVRALLIPAPGDAGEEAQERRQRLESYRRSMEDRVAQAIGRSMFWVPPAPDAAEEAGEEPEAEPEPAGPPPRPSRYGGPEVIAVINGAVWFENDDVVRVGESAGGVGVVSVDGSPWTVRLTWRGVEFDVEIFERTTQRFLAPRRDDDAERTDA